MTHSLEIKVSLGKKCPRCGKGGATQICDNNGTRDGVCIACAKKSMRQKIRKQPKLKRETE